MATAVIVDAIRTAGGKRNGKLSGWHPADLAGEVLKNLVERNDLDPALIDDVIMGCVMQVGNQGLNIGRNAVLAAGFPESVPATSVDRQCGSSQQAAHFAAQGVIAGAYDIAVAAGVEVMTTTPMGASMTPGSIPFGHKVLARYTDPGLVPQGISAEMIADKWGISREELDAFGAESQQRAERATAEGRFDNEIVGVTEKRLDKETGNIVESDELVTKDEGIRPGTTVETLANLKPAFKPDGKVTAGNSSQISDGASAVLVMSEEKAKELGLTPRARFHTFALAGVDPVTMLTGPIPSTEKALAKAGHVRRRHRPVRGQRGLRLGRAGLGEGAQGRPRQDQRQRRRHRPRSPPRRLRHQAHGHAAQRARAHRRPLRPPDHVRRRRPRQRHDHRAPGLSRGTGVVSPAMPAKPPPKRKVKGGRVTPKGGQVSNPRPDPSSRYTPPVPREHKVSPMWVPVLMFTLLGIGLVVIFLNYLGVLPGGTKNSYLLVGLASILGGIMTATQYR